MPDCPLRSEAEQDRLLLEIYELAKKIASGIVVKHQAEDIAHSVVAACLESLRTGNWPHAPENLEAFVFAMVKNRTIDRHRTRRSSARHDASHLRTREEVPPSWSAPDRYGDDEDIRAFIEHVLDKLPDRCATAYSMVRQQGRSHEDVAAHLGVSPASVRTYISQAHARFRAELRLIGIEAAPARRPKRVHRKWNKERLSPRYPVPPAASSQEQSLQNNESTHSAPSVDIEATLTT